MAYRFRVSLERVIEHQPAPAEFAPAVAWKDYLALPDPQRLQLEYEQGKLLVSPTGRNAHDLLRQILSAWLERYEEEFPERCLVVAEHSFFMPPGERDYRPDVAVIVDARKDSSIDPDAWIEGAPDIAIEILSSPTRARDLGLKARRYFEQGTDEYWLFDPNSRTARFLRRGRRGWTQVRFRSGYATPLLPGFRLDIKALWTRLDAKLRR